MIDDYAVSLDFSKGLSAAAIGQFVFKNYEKDSKTKWNASTNCCHSAMILSTERPLFEMLRNANYDGHLYRLTEINIGEKITDSAEHADQLELMMKNNHGLIASYMAKYILDHNISAENICDRIYEIKDTIKQREFRECKKF